MARPSLGARLGFGLIFGLALLLLLGPILSFVNEATSFELYHGWQVSFIAGDFSFFFYWCVYSACFFLCMGGLVLQRNVQPIKPRGPVLQMLCALGGYLCVSWACWMPSADTYTTYWKCTYSRWLLNLGYTCLIVPCFLRSYRLYAVFNLSIKKLTEVEIDFLRAPLLESTSLSDKKRAELRSKHRMGEDFLVGFFCIVLTGVILWTGAMQYFGCDCQSNGTLSNSVWLGAHSFEALTLATMAILLRNVRDEFNIVWELIVVIVVCLLFMTLHVIALFTGFGHWLHSWHYLVAVRSVILLITSVIFPLLFSVYSPPIPIWSDTYTLDSLRCILLDPNAVQYFLAFLTQEFGKVECLQFYMEVEMYRDIHDPNRRRFAASEIYRKYFCSDSPFVIKELEANTSFRNTIEGQLHSPGPNLFQDPQSMAYDMMNDRSFPRFVKSELYQRLRDHLLLQNGVHGRLVLSDMM